jgi:hypothetical protein
VLSGTMSRQTALLTDNESQPSISSGDYQVYHLKDCGPLGMLALPDCGITPMAALACAHIEACHWQYHHMQPRGHARRVRSCYVISNSGLRVSSFFYLTVCSECRPRRESSMPGDG